MYTNIVSSLTLITLIGCNLSPKEENKHDNQGTAPVEDTDYSDDSATVTPDVDTETGDTEESEPEPEPYAELFDSVQEGTFKYFWDFAHPDSGTIREGYTHWWDLSTSGGTGMGFMAIVIGAERGFISREEASQRTLKMVTFLEEAVPRFHGAWPHWFNGSTGEVIPFSEYDDGADLVETAILIQGLLVSRQYFDQDTDQEDEIRTRVNRMWESVEWDWFLNGGNTLYWHWSPNHQWPVNLPIQGYNEALIGYILAIASPNHPIPSSNYNDGWAAWGYANGKSQYGHRQWVGQAMYTPLFLTHYTFMTLDPRNLRDNYCNYYENSRNIALIHHDYAIENPNGFEGYGSDIWGLTAGVNPWGYNAHSPMNDNGTINPTAAIGSIPFTPDESIRALQYFYEDLGSSLWGEYGFVDAFNLTEEPDWFSDTWLAIDQGPILVMIENYRTGLIWDLFMSSPEIQASLEQMEWSREEDAGLQVSYFEGEWESLPDFDTLTPIFQDVVSVPTHAIRNRDDHYGLQFTGTIQIVDSGDYTFYLTSDDGSRLILNGQELIVNDGVHGVVEVTATVTLLAGEYPIQVDYFEKDGGQYLSLEYASHSIEKRRVPVRRFSR